VSDRPHGQFPLPFDHRPSRGGEDFLVGACNAEAVAWIDRWPDWPGPALALAGAPASGKTHLASVFAQKASGRFITTDDVATLAPAELAGVDVPLILDDADGVAGNAEAEQGLFHLLNHLAGRRGALLLVAARPPARWGVRLADLGSRLNAIAVTTIGAPDDALMAALLVKLFADRQLQVGAEVVNYLAARMERSFAAARSLVAALDERALAEQRGVTVALARAVLDTLSSAQD
jgi:chromosomal replication initiation ATPase DnaA